MTVAADTVALNIIYVGLLMMILSIMMKKVASNPHIQFKAVGLWVACWSILHVSNIILKIEVVYANVKVVRVEDFQ